MSSCAVLLGVGDDEIRLEVENCLDIECLCAPDLRFGRDLCCRLSTEAGDTDDVFADAESKERLRDAWYEGDYAAGWRFEVDGAVQSISVRSHIFPVLGMGRVVPSVTIVQHFKVILHSCARGYASVKGDFHGVGAAAALILEVNSFARAVFGEGPEEVAGVGDLSFIDAGDQVALPEVGLAGG